MAGLREIVDAHHHLWDLEAVHYPWLMARGQVRFFGDPAPIQKNYRVDDFREDAQDFELLGSVHVQVGAAAGEDVAETRWLQRTAEACGLPSAIVACGDLAGSDLEEQLDAHAQASRLRGIRQIVGRSDAEDALTGTGRLLDDPRWRAGLSVLAARGLSFDLQLVPAQLGKAAEVVGAVEDLRVALCHCGSPWDQSAAGLAAWRDGLRNLAANPNVYCKLSGFGMFDHGWTVASIRPLVEACLDIFGVERCMFGSNFPVDKLHAAYRRIWQAYDELTLGLGARARRRLFVDNARAFYRI